MNNWMASIVCTGFSTAGGFATTYMLRSNGTISWIILSSGGGLELNALVHGVASGLTSAILISILSAVYYRTKEDTSK